MITFLGHRAKNTAYSYETLSITPSVTLTPGSWSSLPTEVRKKRGREEERGHLGYPQTYTVEQKYSDHYQQQKIAKHLHRRSDFNDRTLVASASSSQRVATTVAAAHAAAAAAHYGGSAVIRGAGGGGGGGAGAASTIAVAPAAAKHIGKSKHSGSSGADGDYQLVQVSLPFLPFACLHVFNSNTRLSECAARGPVLSPQQSV